MKFKIMNKLMEAIKEVCNFLDLSLSEDLNNARIFFSSAMFFVLFFWIFGGLFARSDMKGKKYGIFSKVCLFLANCGVVQPLVNIFDKRNNFYVVVAVLIVGLLLCLFYCFIYSVIVLCVNKKIYHKEVLIDQV